VVAQELQSWMANMCPMSTFALLGEGSGWIGAWETEGQVWIARLGADPVKSVKPSGEPANRKHPTIAVGKEAILLAWCEGTGWEKGGDLAWQVYSRDLIPLGAPGRLPGGIPKWSFPAAWAEADGSFTLVH
jgi:hypothetical protein